MLPYRSKYVIFLLFKDNLFERYKFVLDIVLFLIINLFKPKFV